MKRKRNELVEIRKEHKIKSVGYLPSGERTEENLTVVYGQKSSSGIWEVITLPLLISAVGCITLLMVTVTVNLTYRINASGAKMINHTEGTTMPVSY